MRHDIKSLLMSGIKCQKVWDHKAPDKPGQLNQSQLSPELMHVVTSQPRQAFNPAPVLKQKDTPQETLKKMAGFHVQIQNPLGIDKKGKVIKSKQTHSTGITCFGGNNPALYMKKKKES